MGGLAPAVSEEQLGLRFQPTAGALVEAAWAAADSQEPYLLHIDEINRADLSKVLGEAIYLMEADDRANAAERRRITVPFDFGRGRSFSLPENLHILGTMNTADRSIAIADVAVRRRFAYLNMWPQIDVVRQHGGPLMLAAFQRLLGAFVDHANDDAFALMPGHSYFLEPDEAKASRRLRTSLRPLLIEYLEQGYVAGFAEEIRGFIQWLDVDHRT